MLASAIALLQCVILHACDFFAASRGQPSAPMRRASSKSLGGASRDARHEGRHDHRHDARRVARPGESAAGNGLRKNSVREQLVAKMAADARWGEKQLVSHEGVNELSAARNVGAQGSSGEHSAYVWSSIQQGTTLDSQNWNSHR